MNQKAIINYLMNLTWLQNLHILQKDQKNLCSKLTILIPFYEEDLRRIWKSYNIIFVWIYITNNNIFIDTLYSFAAIIIFYSAWLDIILTLLTLELELFVLILMIVSFSVQVISNIYIFMCAFIYSFLCKNIYNRKIKWYK